jgi:opacity protein-like surface antigen
MLGKNDKMKDNLWILWLVFLIAIVLLVIGKRVHAQALVQEQSIWIGNEPGTGLKKGTWELGVDMAGAIGTKVLSTTEKHDLLMTSLDGGIILTNPIFPNKWYGGNFGSDLTLFGGGQVYPTARDFWGTTLLLKYDFSFLGKVMPYIEGGSGVLWTNIGDPDLTGTFQFNPRVGGGIEYFLTDHTALKAGYDWIHFSNANTRPPNNGLNSQGVWIGFTWYFK